MAKRRQRPRRSKTKSTPSKTGNTRASWTRQIAQSKKSKHKLRTLTLKRALSTQVHCTIKTSQRMKVKNKLKTTAII